MRSTKCKVLIAEFNPAMTCMLTFVLPLQAVLQVVDKLPTIATQLKIIATVKATRQGGDGMYMYVSILLVPPGFITSVVCSYPGSYVTGCK